MHIIVKKHASHALFRPHMNHAMGKYYHTKDDYLSDMKRMGLEPYKKPDAKKESKYEMSKEGAEMIKYAKECERKHRNPDGRFIKALNKLGVHEAPKWLRDAQSLVGGINGEEI